MSFKFNPLTGNLDLTGSSSGGGGSVTSVNGQTGVVVLTAEDISYDNSISGLTADDVQEAIDEISDVIHSGDSEAIYVDANNGNDTTGTGSILYPVATLDKAVTLVTNPALGYVIKLGPGTYNGGTVNWPANADLQGSGANSTIVNNTIQYIAAASSETSFTMSMVSLSITLDFTDADIAIPTFFDGSFNINRIDTQGIGPWAVRVNDSSIGDSVFSGNNLLSNCLFVSTLSILTTGTLYCSDCVIGITVDLTGNAIIGLTGCTVSGTLNGITDSGNTPDVITDAGSITNATIVNCDVVLTDQALYVNYDNSGSGLTSTNVNDAIDEIAANSVTVSDTNSIDLTKTGIDISADLKLSAVPADSNNTLVELDIQADGIRAQIPDVDIKDAALDLQGPNTLLDNTTSTAISYPHASFNFTFIDYSIVRNGNYRCGRLLITNDSSIATIADNGYVEQGVVGVTFGVQISGANVQIQYTTTSTGQNATFKYSMRQWS